MAVSGHSELLEAVHPAAGMADGFDASADEFDASKRFTQSASALLSDANSALRELNEVCQTADLTAMEAESRFQLYRELYSRYVRSHE